MACLKRFEIAFGLANLLHWMMQTLPNLLQMHRTKPSMRLLGPECRGLSAGGHWRCSPSPRIRFGIWSSFHPPIQVHACWPIFLMNTPCSGIPLRAPHLRLARKSRIVQWLPSWRIFVLAEGRNLFTNNRVGSFIATSWARLFHCRTARLSKAVHRFIHLQKCEQKTRCSLASIFAISRWRLRRIRDRPNLCGPFWMLSCLTRRGRQPDLAHTS